MRPDLQRPELIAALQQAAQKRGIKDVAAEMDLAPSSLYACLNPYGDRASSKCGLELALGIMAYTGDKSALSIMAGELGCTLVERRKPDKPSVAEESLQDYAAVYRFTRALQEHASEAELNRLLSDAISELGQSLQLELSLRKQNKPQW